jgi:hypothetical protein
MDVISACELPVGSIVWQTWTGAVVLSVVCKATHRLRSVFSPLADEQDPVVLADRTFYDNPREALQAATDLVPFKRRAEILVVGSARAPHGVAVRSLQVRFYVAGADKTMDIFCDRVFTSEGWIREGAPFVKAQLHWKYAAGGPGTANPLGIRLDAPPDPYGQVLIPRFQPPGTQVMRPGDFIPIIGLGPIAPWWPPRLEKLYRHAHGWDHQRWHLRPLPQDIDAAYFNAAPADQHVDAIRPDERIVLDNLHPDLPHLVTNLSGEKPEAVVERPGKPIEVVPFLCDTMVIDADRGVATLSWRARIILEARDEPGRVHVTLAGAAQPAPREEARVTATTAAVSAAPQVAVASIPDRSPEVAAPPVTPAAPPRPAPSPAPWTPGSPPDRFPLERCAAIAASVARSPNDTAKILEANDLTEDDWDAIEHHWSQVLKREAEEHEDAKQAAYDRAYVLRLEQERGPITPEEYARLALAHERGDRGALTRALRDLGLPWGASKRIERVFAERMAANPALGERVQAAMKE